jgi:Fe-S-cluster containining protein
MKRRAPVHDALGEVARLEREAARVVLRGRPTAAQVLDHVALTLRWVDQLARDAADKVPESGIPDCRAGCAWCCHFHVAATPAEVLLIVDGLRRTLEADELAALRGRVAAADDRVRGLDSRERRRARIACPLLVNGMCSVYADRPLACRGYNSLDVASCQQAVDSAADVRIPSNPLLSAPSEGARVGIAQALMEHGLEPNVELIGALRIALEQPDAAARWLAGDSLFAPVAEELLPGTPNRVLAQKRRW